MLTGMTRPKRILWLTYDHWRYDQLGWAGHPHARTPNLDRLAAGGVYCENAFCQAPVCMPSRGSFMTGLYPSRVGVTANGYELDPEHPNVASRRIGGAGYHTAQVGKLHLAAHEDQDLREPAPARYGFDLFYLSEERGCYDSAYFKWLRGKYPDAVEALRESRPTDPARSSEVRVRIADAPPEATHAGWVVDQTCRLFRSPWDRRYDQPWFVHMGFHHPHPPLNPTATAFAPWKDHVYPAPRRYPDEAADKPSGLADMLRTGEQRSDEYLTTYRRGLDALVTEMDTVLGRLLDQLEAEGALDDTLIIAHSDHGDMAGDHGLTHKGPHFYDEVMRCPVLFHWPAGGLCGGRRFTGLMELVDVLPTILEAAGVQSHLPMDGRSVFQRLTGEMEGSHRDAVFACMNDRAMVRTTNHKLIYFGESGEYVLYDYSDPDPERINHASDPAYSGVLGNLKERLMWQLAQNQQSATSRRFRF